MVGQLGYVLVDLGLQRGGQHPAGALPDDVVDQRAGLGGSVGIHYAEHGRAFLTRVRSSGLLGDQKSITREGTPVRVQPEADPQILSIAQLAGLTGWTCFDARQYNQARAYFTEALQLAKESDDRQFMANVLACMSLQATYQDKPADSLAFVTAAQDQARSALGTTPRVLSMLSMREAFAHAALGNRDSTHRAIGEAHRHFKQIGASDPDPSWVNYFDEPKLIVDTGIAHGRLGEAATAEPLIAVALGREDRTNQRGRAFHAFWLARTQLDQGKLDQACDTATQALVPASAVAPERVLSHLREFYDQLAPHRQKPVALAFEARLRELLPPVSGSLHP
ncbi:hypothetical protein ACWC4A_45215 [Streptomyces mirabilis]